MRTEQEIKDRLAALLDSIDHDDIMRNNALLVAIRELEWVLGARITEE